MRLPDPHIVYDKERHRRDGRGREPSCSGSLLAHASCKRDSCAIGQDSERTLTCKRRACPFRHCEPSGINHSRITRCS